MVTMITAHDSKTPASWFLRQPAVFSRIYSVMNSLHQITSN